MSERVPADLIIASRVFSASDQSNFAALSGDWNPIHVDPVAARRSLVGEVIVHGMHTLSWALNALANSPHRPGAIRTIDARFLKPVYLDETIDLSVSTPSAEELQLRVTSGTKLAVTIKLGISSDGLNPAQGATPDAEPLDPGGTPRDLTFEACKSARGEIPFASHTATFAGAFPAAARILDATALRGLAACSRLVGMECPGLRSVFSRLTVKVVPDLNPVPLRYEVAEADSRFRIVRIDVTGAGLEGRVETFAPAEPPRQLTMDDAARIVPRGKFSAVSALIVGGSRGLGELTAKLLAAGGANVTVTYAAGATDAERIASELREYASASGALRYDVTKPAQEQIPLDLAARVTHAYYFATPSIFRHKTALFDTNVLAEFNRFYCDGFYALCARLSAAGAKAAVYYPSSVAVDERPKTLTEYAMSKAAGEILAADIPRLLPGIRVHMSRLPRLLTDQTASLVATADPPAESILGPIIDEMTKPL